MENLINLNIILPVEVLTSIIVDSVAKDRRFTYTPQHPIDNYLADTALSISHVCQLWRHIALSPGGRRLWTHAPLRHNPSCVEAFMQRSHPLPVFLKIEAFRGKDWEPISTSFNALQTALQYSHRVDTMVLYFYVEYDDNDQDFDDWWNEKYSKTTRLLDEHVFPLLEFLSWTTAFHGHTFSPQLFNAEVPLSLRRLHLWNAYFDSSIPILRAPLTSLVIDEGLGWSGIDDFIATLLRMPSLETLVLHSEMGSVIDATETSTQHQFGSVPLPFLTRLVLSDTLNSVPLVLAYIRAPMKCRIDLTLEFDDFSRAGDQYWECWATLHQALNAHFGCSFFDRVVASGTGIDSDRFEICASSVALPTFHLSFLTGIEAFGREDNRLLRTLRDLIMLPFLSQATTVAALDIGLFESSLYEPDSAVDDDTRVNPFTSAREAIATRSAVDDLVHGLIRQPNGPLLPEVQTIEFRQALFCRSDLHAVEPLFATLIGALAVRERLASAQAVTKIEFKQCGLTEEAAGILVEVVQAEVFWDEHCLSSQELAAMKDGHSDLWEESILLTITDNADVPY